MTTEGNLLGLLNASSVLPGNQSLRVEFTECQRSDSDCPKIGQVVVEGEIGSYVR